MKITRVESRIVEVPLDTRYVFSHVVMGAFTNVLVWIHTDDSVGVGEASFGQAVYEETPEGVKVVIDKYLAPALVGEDPFDIERIDTKLDALLPGNLVAKSGIDLALWDVMGKALNVPAYQLLGGMVDPKIRCTSTLSIDTPVKMAEKAQQRKQQGYKTLVVKVGREPDTDVERLQRVRDAVGSDLRLRVDVNEAYAPDQAIRIIRQMEQYEPEFIEEPVKRWDIDGMARVARAVAVPICSDESNSTLQSVARLIDRRAAGVINIKLSKNGGLHRAKKIAALAEAAGLPVILGGATTFEVARQAHRHFAVSTTAAVGMGSEGCAPASQSKEDDITTRFHTYDDVTAGGGYLEVISGPGLGVVIDEKKLARYTLA